MLLCQHLCVRNDSLYHHSPTLCVLVFDCLKSIFGTSHQHFASNCPPPVPCLTLNQCRFAEAEYEVLAAEEDDVEDAWNGSDDGGGDGGSY